LTSTSHKAIAQEVLDACLAGNPPRELPRALVEEGSAEALFGVLAEGLSDRFEPALCDAYAHLFSQAVEGADPAALVAHYRAVRQVRPAAGNSRQVFVLSRITLGADVAVTSVVLDAAKRRFPDAPIVFVGPHKNFELFAADPRVRHAPIAYRRGSLQDRLAVWGELKALAEPSGSLVIDPDSRLTQLGLLPICPDDRHHLFECRSYGGDTARSLPELTAAWCAETLGVTGAKPYVALGQPPACGPYIAISLGIGENPAKRLDDPFEEELLRLLAATGLPIWIDKGAGGAEAERVARAVERAGVPADFWEGSFAGFASIIAASRLYVGYDSAGQHVAAASGVPLISIFTGFTSPRMFDRWRPVGERCAVIRVDRPDAGETLARVRDLLGKLKI
jgi:hypothetical protein